MGQDRVAQSIHAAAETELQPRLEVSFEDCVLVRQVSRPMRCDGAAAEQIIVSRVDLTEIAQMRVSNAIRDNAFFVMFDLDVPSPPRRTLLRDQVLYGEDAAFERYRDARDAALLEMAPQTGTRYAACDGTFDAAAPRSTASMLLERRPAAWPDFVAAARACGVRQITDTYVAPSP